MKNLLFYVFLTVFAITALVTLLGITQVITIKEVYLNKLFYALLLELIVPVITLFKNTEFFVKSATDKINESEVDDTDTNLEFFDSRTNEGAEKYNISHVLCELGSGDELLVIARTCLSWFSEDKEQVSKKLVQEIYDAINRGATIKICLQDLLVEETVFSLKHKDRLEMHQGLALDGVGEVKSLISKSASMRQMSSRFEIKFIQKDISNSVVLITKEGRPVYLLLDFGIGFTSKPFLVLHDKESLSVLSGEVHSDYSEALSEDDHMIINGKREIENLEAKYTEYIPQRKNNPKDLEVHFAKWFLHQNKIATITTPPPVSVQILLTNKCSTNCVMCSHYELGASRNDSASELDSDQIQAIFRLIDDMGTHSIIMSGGEPLIRKNFKELLEYASLPKKNSKERPKNEDNYGLGMHVGLLTSGVYHNGVNVPNNIIQSIAKHCDWVQISIDSFKENQYEGIRHRNLRVALNTIDKLVDYGAKDVQICYTIQKNNFKEIIDYQQPHEEFGNLGFFDYLKDNFLDRGVSVRFKFAHGFEKQYLFDSEAQVRDVIKSIRDGWEDKYLFRCIETANSTYPDIVSGLPLRTKMLQNEKKKNHTSNYTCQATKLSLLINSNGEVYPCCYLFDDNEFESEYREDHLLGTLVNKRLDFISEGPGEGNPLRKIWQDGKINRYRKQQLPVQVEACSKCIRHMHQNDFFNEYLSILSNHQEKDYELAKIMSDKNESVKGVWV